MAEPKMFTYKMQELAGILVRERGLKEGHWGLAVKFSLQAANIGDATGQLFPAAIVPIVELGIQRFDEPSPLTVDASKLDPAAPEKTGER